MTADELFKELGYIKDTKRDKLLLVEMNDEKVNIVSEAIVYWKEYNEKENKAIVFTFHCKTVKKSFWNKNDERVEFFPNGSFTKEEIIAINKKVEELGW